MAYLQTNSKSAPATRQQSDDVTTFGHGMLVIGNVVSTGEVNVHGRVVGDIHAARIVIAEGARVDGNVTAQDAVIRGAFKGILRGGSVRLQSSAMVEGEVYNNSLAIEENAVFEGVARRLDRPVETPNTSDIAAKAATNDNPFVEADTLQLAPENIVAQTTGIDNSVLA